MSNRVYVSLNHDDPYQKAALGLLIRSPGHSFDSHDRTVAGDGKMTVGPDDPRSKPLRDEISRKLEAADRLVVLIGAYTYMDDWVRWEIDTFYDLKRKAFADNTWRLIRGMRIETCPDAIAPGALGDRSTDIMSWDPKALDRWLDETVTA